MHKVEDCPDGKHSEEKVHIFFQRGQCQASWGWCYIVHWQAEPIDLDSFVVCQLVKISVFWMN